MDASRAPVVVALMGVPGSGKTTLAETLAPLIPARIVCRDAIRAAMFRPCSFTDEEKAAAFEALLEAVGANCALGQSSLVDGMPFSREGELEAVQQVSARHGCRSLTVLCSVPVAEAERRVERQTESEEHTAEDRGAELVTEVAERFRPLPEGVLELDATRPAEELARAVLRRIDEPPGAVRPPPRKT